MDYLQEIYFYADSNVQFTCHIISTNNAAPFSAESLTYDPRINQVYSSLHPIGNQYKDAKDAFQDIMDYVKRYTAANNLQLQKINNPCNAPFINRADQQAVVNSAGFTATVLINGK